MGLTEQEQQAKKLIANEIEKAFKILTDSLESAGVATGGLVRVAYVKACASVIVNQLNKEEEKEDDSKGSITA